MNNNKTLSHGQGIKESMGYTTGQKKAAALKRSVSIEKCKGVRGGKKKDLKELAELLETHRAEKRSVVLCHGVFDLLHIGHIRYLEQARRMGDVLVVTVTPDRFVDKGPHRPAFTEDLRVEATASLNCVDYVAINHWPTAVETLRILRPDFYVKGSEFKDTSSDITGKIGLEEKTAGEVGAELVFTEDITFSSTNLINRYLSGLPDEIDKYLSIFRRRYTLEEVLEVIGSMASLDVLVIGDTILDDYHFCRAIGKSSKDPALALKHLSNDMFAGGVLAVANHVAGFVNSVKLVTVIGEKDSYKEFIGSQLQPNISPYLVLRPDAPTLIKRRFIDGYSLNKLFEVYIMDDSGLPQERSGELCKMLQGELRNYDLAIVADFGHGTIDNQMIRTICDHSRFMAVNVQANAGNRGFNTVTRYPRCDYACLAEHELRLETRAKNGDIRPMMKKVARKLNYPRFALTRGRKGCSILNGKGLSVEVPSFARNVVDRVGAGDAFFSVTSMAALLGAPSEVLGFIGNVAGSMAVGTLGNKKHIDKPGLKKYIVSLMK